MNRLSELQTSANTAFTQRDWPQAALPYWAALGDRADAVRFGCRKYFPWRERAEPRP